MSTSQHDENPVTVSEAKQFVKATMASNLSTMIWGAPGIGKSEVVEQIAEEQNRPLIDLRLLLMEPTDLRGIPFKTNMDVMDPETGETVHVDTVRWAPPEELPRIGFKDNAIIFLDEISAAPPTVQAAAYQLILNRRIGAYKVPDGVNIVAAGNRQSDKGVAFRMPTPLANRFIHCTLICDWTEWKSWAVSSGKVHADVIAYHIESGGKDLFTFNPKTNKEVAFATPRSWVFASNLIRQNTHLSEKITRKLVAGSIGEGLAKGFMTFRKVNDQLPRTEDILSGKVKVAKNLKEMSAKYLVIINLCHYLKDFFEKHELTESAVSNQAKNYEKVEKELVSMCDNFMTFVIDNFEDELTILGLRTALFDYNLPFPYGKMKTFDRFVEDYKEFIL